MGRHLRFFPEGALVEITCRTVQGRLLLRPSPQLNALALGVLGRAQSRSDMVIHSFVVLSNHLHLILSPESPRQLAAFMQFFAGNLAREVGLLHDWRGGIWSRRYQAIVVSNEESAQVERLLYILRHGVKEHLVSRPQDWPGAHSVDALLEGRTLEGIWIDRTRERRRHRDSAPLDPRAWTSREIVVLSQLPCWQHLSAEDYRARIADLVTEVEAEGARLRSEVGPPLGRDRVLRQSPHERPKSSKHSPAPLVHAASREVRLAFLAAYRTFVAAYRRAADAFRAGFRLVCFPERSFPPPLPASG